jgi:hypothetical protein
MIPTVAADVTLLVDAAAATGLNADSGATGSGGTGSGGSGTTGSGAGSGATA